MDRRLLEYMPLLEALGSSEFERDAGRTAVDQASPFNHGTELALAAELLAITSEAELDRMLATLVASAGAGPAHTPAARSLVAQLKLAARPVLQPLRGIACGTASRRSIQRAAQVFGLELEGLSPEDQEFELALQFVRFAGAAARNASRGDGAPAAVAAKALQGAARASAPGLLPKMKTRLPQQGRWIRTGNRIALLGV
jgi:hypothetical protein